MLELFLLIEFWSVFYSFLGEFWSVFYCLLREFWSVFLLFFVEFWVLLFSVEVCSVFYCFL